MSRVTLGIPSRDDIEFVSQNLREADRVEYVMSTGRDPAKTLPASVELADDYRCGYVDGTPVALYGRSETRPWLLGTDGIAKAYAGRLLVRHGRELLEEWSTEYGVLRHSAYAENTLHHRYIMALGCEFERVVHRGPFNAPFMQFVYKG